MVNSKTENYFSLIQSQHLYSSKKYFKFKIEQVFNTTSFIDKKFLDIGGGKGLFSIYASCMGASKVVCIEPEADGSTAGASSLFPELSKELDLKNCELIPTTFQDFDSKGERFDLILLHNSVNHLDEPSCVTLLIKPDSEKKYLDIFSKLFTLSAVNAELIVCDCSNSNFFNIIGLKSPFARTIEWHKHQDPIVWKKLLEKSGFTFIDLQWTVPNYFGKLGKLLLGNRIGTFFISSTFCLRMKKQNKQSS